MSRTDDGGGSDAARRVSDTGDRAEVVRRELLLLDPAVRADRRRLLGLLHPDFVEFGASGRIWDAEALADALAAEGGSAGVEVSDLVPARVCVDTVLLTYRIDDQEGSSLRSSVWLRNDAGQWLLRFHQGTRLAIHTLPLPPALPAQPDCAQE